MFFLYNLFFFPLLLILLPSYLLRMVRRGGYQNKMEQRFGIFDAATLAHIGTGRIWIHAASVGEVGIALKFIAQFQTQHPNTRFVLSVTTSTGIAIAEKKTSPYLEVIANPIDFPFLTSQLVKQFRPAGLLFVEADLWPNRIAAARSLGIPVILINARLSLRSEKRFRKARALTSPLFNSLSGIILTEPEDPERWLSLGVHPHLLHSAGNIKYDSPLTAQPPAFTLPMELGWQSSDPVFLAASTHEGEELEIARAFQIAHQHIPCLRLIIAPRHIERRHRIIEMLQKLGLSVALRSQEITSPTDLLLLDTTGELSNWYPFASIVFVGKSLACSVNHGGQNMIEPLQAGTAVLIGPYTSNFEPLATRLCKAGVATRVTNAEDIAKSLQILLSDPSQRKQMILSASFALEQHQGATKRTCELVASMINPDFGLMSCAGER